MPHTPGLSRGHALRTAAVEVKSLPMMQEPSVQSLGREVPWSRRWQLSPALLSEEFHGQRSLAGYSPWVAKS